MKIMEVQERTSMLIEQLLAVWEDSVRATHLFLSDEEIRSIKPYVPQAIEGVAHLYMATEAGQPVAFMGTETGRWKCFSLRLRNAEKDWENNCWNGLSVMKRWNG